MLLVDLGHGDQQWRKQVHRVKPEMNECAAEQVCRMQMIRTADIGSDVPSIYQASLPQQLLVEEHSRQEWSEEGTYN